MAETKAVLFDMDGVIVDSESYWEPLQRERLFPAAGVEEASVAETTGMNFREIYQHLDREYGVEISREEFLEIFDEIAHEIYTERVALMDGFRDLQGTLRDRGLKVAVVTSSPPDWIDLVLERFELSGFDAIVSADTIDEPGKPEPHVYRHTAEELDLDPENCVVVEDSVHGVRAAIDAGMDCIGYPSGGSEELDLSAADVVVSGPQELRAELLA